MMDQSGVRKRLAGSVLRQAAWVAVGWVRLLFLPGPWALVVERIPGSADCCSISCSSTDGRSCRELQRKFPARHFRLVLSHSLTFPLSPHLSSPHPTSPWFKAKPPNSKQRGHFYSFWSYQGWEGSSTFFSFFSVPAHVLRFFA